MYVKINARNHLFMIVLEAIIAIKRLSTVIHNKSPVYPLLIHRFVASAQNYSVECSKCFTATLRFYQ